MRIIDGLNDTYKLNVMIQECIQQAKEHPFESYYFIVEDTHYVEQLFFQYTHYLVNIEIMTWTQFLKQMIIENHLTHHHLVTNIELTYHLRNILNHDDFYCFHSQQPYPLIDKLIPLIKDYNLNETFYDINTFENDKLKDFIHLYTSLKVSLDSFTHISLEDILNNVSFNTNNKHLYIEADHLYQKKRQNIMKQFPDITILYTYHDDQRLFNLPYHALCQNAYTIDQAHFMTEYLFTQKAIPQKTHSAYTFIASTPYQEVKNVVLTIAQKIVDEGLHYQDFVIVYPDSTYIPILISVLDATHLLHDIPITSSCQYDMSYQKILSSLNDIHEHTYSDIVSQLLKEELDEDYHQYLTSLKDYQDDISNQEFKLFFQSTYTKDHVECINNEDHIQVCTINQLKLSKPKHIFFLGMNETVFPHIIKDTSLLLDEDIECLRQNNISTPLTTTEQLGIHHNDILKAFIQPSLSITFSYSQHTLSGETLLESSLYKQLKKIYNFIPLPISEYISDDDYYLMGGLLSDKTTLNTHIHHYLETKNQPILLSKEIVENLYSPTLSVSQIETYNKCPFLYFIQYGLRLSPIKEQKLLPNELGSLVHYVLSINIDDDQDIDMIVDQYIENDESLKQKINSSYINQYFIKQLKKDLVITLNVLKRQLEISDFKVFAKERKVDDEIAGMHFKGFVDRIDIYNNAIAIIDYKSSDKDIDFNLAMQGFNIQMLLYLKMVTQKYHKDPGAVLYFNTKKRILSLDTSLNEPIDENDFYKQYRFGGYVVDDENHQNILALDPRFDKKSDIINVTYVKSRNEYKGQLVTQSQLSLLLEEIEKHIYQLYLEMIQGNIQIEPKGSDQKNTHALVNPCSYCPNHSICSFDVFYNDYKLVEFLDVEEILGGEDNAI